MAAVLDALAPYVKKLILDMAEEEVSMLLGVSGEITKLEDNMESVKAFLADAERRRVTDQSVQRWVRKLKDAMYDATDIIDLCQLEANKRRERNAGGRSEEKMPGCFQQLLFCLWNPMFAHEIGGRIKELNQRLDGIHKEADMFKFNINLGSNTEPRKLTDAEKSHKMMSSEFDESAIVGEKIEKDTKELAQVLITDDDNHGIKVVSIVGTGGMGKTTLAQKIFNDAKIQEHFKVKIWLSINKHFDETEVLRSAIKHAGREHGEERDMSILIRTLTDALSVSRFLVVMDDVWSEEAWKDVLSVPIMNAKQPGSRVLVTTRFEDLAPKMGECFHRHHVSPLDEEDAWSLLKKQLTPNQVVGIDWLKNIGMEILQRCDGLPLAIKVIGGLLSTRYPSEGDWKAVLKSPGWSIAGLPQQLDNRLYLSYEDLSPQLKQCFLYCSLFPKGTKLAQRAVTHMWISEGFIQPWGEISASSSHEYGGLEDIAIKYYQELIKRNLIEPIQKFSLTGYMCTMHDVVRSFAEYMAREESLVVVDDKQAATCGGGIFVRRLSIGHAVSVAELLTVSQRQKSLIRTLIISSRENFKPGDCLGSFSSLRVLCTGCADSDRLVASLSKLKHLRYLHLENTDVSRLPDDIHEMKFLQYITLIHCKKLGHLPSSTVKLMQLRSLDITGSNVSALPKGFGGLTNMRLLYGFPVHVDMDNGTSSWCSLQELAPLSQLRKLTLDGLHKVPASWMAEEAMISCKGHLSYLELRYTASSGQMMGPGGEAEQQQQQTVIEEVMEKLCPPTCLETLAVRGGYAGRQLPNWMQAPASADFKSLRYLVLENLPCCPRLPDGLCCIPCLQLLTIEDAPAIKCIGHEFQASSPLAARDSAATPVPFPKLRELQLLGLPEWEEWDWNGCEEQGDVKAAVAMPCLETLWIKNCKLSRLPPGLANSNRHAMRELNLHKLTNLMSVENFPSVVQLKVFDCPRLRRISGLPRLHDIRIVRCPSVEVLEGVPSLDSLVLEDTTMETLPGYLQAVNPRYLELDCSKKMCEFLSPGSSEWNKISHIRKCNIVDIEY